MIRLRTLLAAGAAVALALSLSLHTRAQDAEESEGSQEAETSQDAEASQEAEAPEEEVQPTALETIRANAAAIRSRLQCEVTRRFVDSTADLPEINETRDVYYRRSDRGAMTPEQYEAASEEEREGFELATLDESFYYMNRYGTPVSYARPIDLVALQGMESIEEKNIIDFGWGGIGQLRMMASLGASVTGIEIDQLNEAFYRESMDTGIIPRATAAGLGPYGHLRTLYGRFPEDAELSRTVGSGYHLFMSKNTLKRGYIHPEGEADPRALIDLGATDEEFVQRLFNLLTPGGIVMIYNLHPAMAAEGEKYIPWADGRCPFDQELLEEVGFEVIAFDVDDTRMARRFAHDFGWREQGMDVDNNLFATYTMFRRPLR